MVDLQGLQELDLQKLDFLGCLEIAQVVLCHLCLLHLHLEAHRVMDLRLVLDKLSMVLLCLGQARSLLEPLFVLER